MTPERSAALLRAVLISMDGWVTELRTLEGCCPAKVVHLRAAVEQAAMCLETILQHEDEGRE